jgi:hypothetical protein
VLDVFGLYWEGRDFLIWAFVLRRPKENFLNMGRMRTFLIFRLLRREMEKKHQLASDHPRQVRPIFVVTRRRAAGSIGVLSCSSKNEEPKLKSRKTK